MYQIMVEHKDEYGNSYMVRSGRISTKLKLLKRRLAKHSKGWIMNMNSKKIEAARGFSRQAMSTISVMGVVII